jgi:hypothetical protein
MPIGGPISAIVALPAKVADVQIPAIVANAGQRSTLNVCDLPLGLRGHIDTRVTRIKEDKSTQETRVTN